MNNRPVSQILKHESNIKFQYRRFIRNSTDPFKRIVWAVLGCCDVGDEHTEVAKTADDYLWLKLILVRVNSNKEDHVDYKELQVSILANLVFIGLIINFRELLSMNTGNPTMTL